MVFGGFSPNWLGNEVAQCTRCDDGSPCEVTRSLEREVWSVRRKLETILFHLFCGVWFFFGIWFEYLSPCSAFSVRNVEGFAINSTL